LDKSRGDAAGNSLCDIALQRANWGDFMNFKKIYAAGLVARTIGQARSDNPYYRSENLPAETAAAYRAWQIKAETWELGWCEQDTRLNNNRCGSHVFDNLAG